MTDTVPTYNCRAIYELLLAAFTPQELRRFCRHRDDFEPLLTRFGDRGSLEEMADEVVAYCGQYGLWEQLLEGVKEHNPYQHRRLEDRVYEREPMSDAQEDQKLYRQPQNESSQVQVPTGRLATHPTQSEELDPETQRSIEIYTAYVEEWAERVNLDAWLGWTSYLLSPGGPQLKIAHDRQLKESQTWLLTRL